jgi:hypothetical protein
MLGTEVVGFDEVSPLPSAQIRAMLAEFPANVVTAIAALEYRDGMVFRAEGWDLGKTLELAHRRYRIVIFRHGIIRRSRPEVAEQMRDTILHQVGHVVYRGSMTEEERGQWGKKYTESLQTDRFVSIQARAGAEEDFCEAYRLYKRSPVALMSFDADRYTFIQLLERRLGEVV